MPRFVCVPDAAALARADSVVRRHLTPTPLVGSDCYKGAQLKLECFQPTGSFKVRGALAALAALDGSADVVTASAGNHGLGIAYAAHRLGIAATVVVPESASASKVAALRRFGVTLVQDGADYDAAEQMALELAATAGMTYVSPYNDGQVIAGQSTIGPELANQMDGPLTVVTPVGGGGLAAGLALWAAGRPDVTIVGVEAAASRAVSTAMVAGKTVPVTLASTLADGLSGNLEPGSVTPEILAAHAINVVAVSESEIQRAMRFLAAEHGLVVEGSGAVAVAALLAGAFTLTTPPVALITGRNVALPTFGALLA